MIFCQILRARPVVSDSTSFTVAMVTGSSKSGMWRAAALFRSDSISLE